MKSVITAPFILDLALDGGEWPTLRPGCFPPMERTLACNEYRLDGPFSRSKCFGEEKNIILPLT